MDVVKAGGIWIAALLASLTAAGTLVYSLSSNAVTAPENKGAQTPVTLAQPLDPPVVAVVSQMVGQSAAWSTDLSVSSRCDLPSPVVSASSVDLEVAAYPTGYGAKVMDILSECEGSDPQDRLFLLGTSSVQLDIGDQTFSMFNRGDVVVALPNLNVSFAQETDAKLTLLLQESNCLDLHPSVEDATRNPINPDYTQWLAPSLVSIPSVSDIDPGPESEVPTLLDLPEPTTVPPDLKGPPAIDAVVRPTELRWPGYEPVQATVDVPKADTLGPGCGWTFNGQTPPDEDVEELDAQAEVIVEEGRKRLTEVNQEWQESVPYFKRALPEYQLEAEAWNGYVEQMRVVQGQWARQLGLIAEYNKQKAEYDSAKAAFDAWSKDHSEAQARWEKEVRDCEQSAQSNVLAESYCSSIAKPDILRGSAPVVGPAPTRPELWGD